MKKIGFVLLAVLIFGLFGCGGGGGGSDAGSGGGGGVDPSLLAPEVEISGLSSTAVLPVGGPYFAEISGSMNTVTAPVTCLLSRLDITGQMNNATFNGVVDTLNVDSQLNDLIFNAKVTTANIKSQLNEVWFYADVNSVTVTGSSNTIYLPIGSTASVIDSGLSTSVIYSLPAIP